MGITVHSFRSFSWGITMISGDKSAFLSRSPVQIESYVDV